MYLKINLEVSPYSLPVSEVKPNFTFFSEHWSVDQSSARIYNHTQKNQSSNKQGEDGAL